MDLHSLNDRDLIKETERIAQSERACMIQLLHHLTPTGGSEHTCSSRHIPSAIQDEVYTRDGGQCTYTARDGTRCGSRKGLEIDHIRPVAAGGTNDPSNLRLLCPAHNLRAAERALGAQVMASFWQRE